MSEIVHAVWRRALLALPLAAATPAVFEDNPFPRLAAVAFTCFVLLTRPPLDSFREPPSLLHSVTLAARISVVALALAMTFGAVYAHDHGTFALTSPALIGLVVLGTITFVLYGVARILALLAGSQRKAAYDAAIIDYAVERGLIEPPLGRDRSRPSAPRP